MDAKDLEIITHLYKDGRYSCEMLSSLVKITPDNVHRRINLMRKESIIHGFSAFVDRRIFNYDTTYVKLNFDARSRKRILDGVLDMVQVASVLINLDDFMICEVVHYDRASLMAAIRSMERIATPFGVSAHFVPRFNDDIPEVPSREEISLVKALIKDGRASDETLSGSTGIEVNKVPVLIEKLRRDGVLKIMPLVNEGEIEPFPSVSAIIIMNREEDTDKDLTAIMNIAKNCYRTQVLQEPPGLWIRYFGKDLHEMDDLLERIRRSKGVEDLMVILPDGIYHNREVDINMILGDVRRIS